MGKLLKLSIVLASVLLLQLVHLHAEQSNKPTNIVEKDSARSHDETNQKAQEEIPSYGYEFGQPELRVYHDMFTEQQMDVIHEFYTNIDQLHNNYTLAELGAVALTAKYHSLISRNQPKHRYDSLADLKQSFGPYIDNEHCVRQLTDWINRAESLKAHKFQSRDINLYRLLDTFGRVPAGFAADSARWTGMYDECLAIKMDSPKDGPVPTRYCLASIKHQHWTPELPYSHLFAAELGVCLPKSCDSLKYKNKYDLIAKLIDFNWREVEKGQATMESLYCLPDEDSPLRMWWNSPRVRLAIVITGTWAALMIYATIKYERFRKLVSGKTDGEQITSSKLFKYCQVLSVLHNFRILFDIKESSEHSGCKEISPKENRSSRKDKSASPIKSEEKLVDLRCMDGIKVITMVMIIVSHIFLIVSDPIFNRVDATPAISVIYALFVNVFFTVSGILNAYLLFKRSKAHSFSSNPLDWVSTIRTRYLRLIPMYAITVYFIKYILKFLGSGPMWDYGTSSLEYKRRCENESWLKTLLFKANFWPLLENCSSNGWYLANDFQFFLVTPIFLVFLHKNRKLGEKLVKFFIVAGYLGGIVSILTANAPDMRPLGRPMPHSFPTYQAYAFQTYSYPQFRIPAYLLGLLTGYKLFTYEQEKRKYLLGAKKKDSPKGDQQEPQWPGWLLKYGWTFCLCFMVSCILVVAIIIRQDCGKLHSRIAFSLFISTYHLMFATATGISIILLTTGYGNKIATDFLAAPFWKPLARMSLSVSMFNLELIRYMDTIPKHQIYLDFWNLTSQTTFAIVASYFGATIIYILFEAPISALLQHWKL